MADGRAAETGTIGPEGFVGFAALRGDETGINRTIVQVPGTASALPLEVLQQAAQRSPALHGLLLRYVKVLLDQSLQAVACNSLHDVQRRCARWLLMCPDRANRDTFSLTQELLVEMLGVRRQGVSEVSSVPQAQGLIRYSRGSITILDREGLGAVSCECYGVIRQITERLLPKTYP